MRTLGKQHLKRLLEDDDIKEELPPTKESLNEQLHRRLLTELNAEASEIAETHQTAPILNPSFWMPTRIEMHRMLWKCAELAKEEEV